VSQLGEIAVDDPIEVADNASGRIWILTIQPAPE